MIDKTLRKTTVTRNGPIVTVSMTGGGDCLWLLMYLDCKHGQMTCDSDIGAYSYHWGRWSGEEDFINFCIRWLSNEEWLLRKCIGEQHGEKAFNAGESAENLRNAYKEAKGDDWNDDDYSALEDTLDEAYAYSDNVHGWLAAIDIAASTNGVDLPEEWYRCVSEDYTPWQKRFAEICRENIVPALRYEILEQGKERMKS